MEDIKEKAIRFIETFLESLFIKSKNSYRKNIEFLPKILYANDLLIDIAYTSKTNHYLFHFTRSFTRKTIVFTFRNGDILNHLDKLNIWETNNTVGSLGTVDNRTMILDDVRNVFITSSKPFEIQGINNLMLLETFPINLPIIGCNIIEFALIISGDRLNYYLRNPNVLENIIYDFYLHKHPETKLSQHLVILNNIKEEFSKLLSSNVDELLFDSFFFKNSIILEIALNVAPVESQIILEDIHGQYNQDLRPDLLAYDELSNCYVIIDYKRADVNLLKSFKKVGMTFSAKIHDLIDQLNLYCEYFNDFQHKEHILKKYNYNIKSPKGIGIIGQLENSTEADEFNKCERRLSTNIKLFTYSNIYDSFNKYIKRLIDFVE